LKAPETHICYNKNMKTALILIDIQNDYFPGGRGELENPLEAARQARKLLDYFRIHQWPTVHIQHVAIRPGASTFLPDTEGVKIHPYIAPQNGETVIVKHFPNSFRETGLLEHLQELDVERLVLCGMMTHMCVDAGMRAAADFGYPVLLAADACATRALTYAETKVPAEHVQAAFLAALKSYGQVLKTEEILELL
jgi:nicotinamidase-related amidase